MGTQYKKFPILPDLVDMGTQYTKVHAICAKKKFPFGNTRKPALRKSASLSHGSSVNSREVHHSRTGAPFRKCSKTCPAKKCTTLARELRELPRSAPLSHRSSLSKMLENLPCKKVLRELPRSAPLVHRGSLSKIIENLP